MTVFFRHFLPLDHQLVGNLTSKQTCYEQDLLDVRNLDTASHVFGISW